MATQQSLLAFTDKVVLEITEVLNLLKELEVGSFEQYHPQIITQATSLRELPLESSSVDLTVALCGSQEFPAEGLYKEISRVLKPDGTVVIYRLLHATETEASSVERKLLLAGFLDAQCLQIKSDVNTSPCFLIKAKKPSWKIGSSFAIKKPLKSLPVVQLNDDDDDLIDEDSLLTEDDLKKPQLLPVGDCEIGSTRKACKNCTCGRAEAEEKVEKLGLTVDQLNNPQSACGSCGLGDAFRCSTCPYKGLPPFKLGEKVSLSSNFLVSDI